MQLGITILLLKPYEIVVLNCTSYRERAQCQIYDARVTIVFFSIIHSLLISLAIVKNIYDVGIGIILGFVLD